MARQGFRGASPPRDRRVADRELAWIGRIPDRLRPYAVLARWDRPIGTWLLFLPCLWGLALAPGAPAWWYGFAFAIGAIAMRGAGCTINDLWDRDLDAKVERTRNRPLASGQLNPRQALAFLTIQLVVGAAVLACFDRFTIALALASVPLIVVYPLMKRVTWWPQAVLGITFNWGALVGWSAVTGGLAWPPVLLYLAGFFWTLGYDTIYAHQDKHDDALIGVRSSARRLGAATRPWLTGFYGTTLALLALGGWLVGLTSVYLVCLVPVALHFAWQIKTLRIDDSDNCLARFRSNRDLGLLVLAALVLGKVLTW